MSTDFPASSRYALVPTTAYVGPDGRTVRHLRRRFLPQPEALSLLRAHTVTQGERLDNVTAAYLADPEQFWRVGDANRAMRPDDLMRVGHPLRITLPAGIPGGRDA